MRSQTLIIWLATLVVSSAQQVTFQNTQDVFHIEQGMSPSFKAGRDLTVEARFSETIVSTLSKSDQHTTFITLLQRSKCIPLLAHINTSTVFAPTDKAWAEWAEDHKPEKGGDLVNGWLAHTGLDPWLDTQNIDVATEAFDNQNWALRQHLLYHMLNYTLAPENLVAGNGTNITTETTLLFPMAEEPEHTPVPPPGPPWLPRGGEGLLSGHGQRLRIARGGSEAGGERGRIGVDWLGKAGVSIWDGSGWKEDGNSSFVDISGKGKKHKGDQEEKEPEVKVKGMRWVRNGVVIGVDGVLEPPPSIGKPLYVLQLIAT
jgi:uncharacterized surface protein with fasciclin (FAS1) repeats